MNDIKKNNFCLCVSTVLHSITLLILNGSILQSFMLETGIAEKKVTMFVSLLQIIQCVFMIICSGRMDKVKNVIKATALLPLMFLPMYGALLLFCFFPQFSTDITFLTILVMGILFSIGISLYTIVVYKLPCHVLNMDSFGRISGIAGLFCGIAGIAVSTLMTFSLGHMEYYPVMIMVFSLGVLVILLSTISTLHMKKINPCIENTNNAEKIRLFRYKPFYLLIFPNLFRGICAGIIGVAAVIGYYYNLLDSTSSGYLAIITNVATLAGCYIYILTTRNGNKQDGKLLVLSSIAILVLLPCMILGQSTTLFLAMYCVCFLFRTLVDYAVPVVVYRIADYQIIGQYNAWRMMIHTLGVALGGLICIPLFDLAGGIATLLLAGSLQLISGIAYYIVERKILESKQIQPK